MIQDTTTYHSYDNNNNRTQERKLFKADTHYTSKFGTENIKSIKSYNDHYEKKVKKLFIEKMS